MAFLIDSNSTARSLGVSLFKGFEHPNAPATATFIHEYGGLAPALRMGSSTPFYEQPRVQIIDRSTDYQTARNSAEKWYKLLMGQRNTTLKPSSGATGTRYLTLSPVQAPFYLGQDANGYHQMSCNYQVQKSLST